MSWERPEVEGAKNPRRRRDEHARLNGDVLLDPDSGELFVAWPFCSGAEWETDYQDGRAINQPRAWMDPEQDGRLVLIGNLFGWDECP